MSNNHLTDDIIQAYILQEVSDPEVALHISTCAACKAKLASYQVLISTIDKIEAATFSFDATALVMQKIEQHESKKASIGSYVLTTILGMLILGVFAICIPFIKPVFQVFHSITGIANLFIIVSALSVFIFLMMDIVRQYKQKEMRLLE